MILTILITLLVSSTAFGHPTIESNIKRLKPQIDKKLARRIANAVFMTSVKHNIKPKLLTAIIMQESSFKIDAVNCTKTACHDFGLTQVNIKTARAYGFEVHKLLTNPEYAVQCMGIILSDMRRSHGKTDSNWWTRYNASNPQKRAIYHAKVSRYFL